MTWRPSPDPDRTTSMTPVPWDPRPRLDVHVIIAGKKGPQRLFVEQGGPRHGEAAAGQGAGTFPSLSAASRMKERGFTKEIPARSNRSRACSAAADPAGSTTGRAVVDDRRKGLAAAFDPPAVPRPWPVLPCPARGSTSIASNTTARRSSFSAGLATLREKPRGRAEGTALPRRARGGSGCPRSPRPASGPACSRFPSSS